MPIFIARKHIGFTIIELVVASALMLLLGLIATLWLSGTIDLWWTSTTRGDAQTSCAHALSRLIGELRSGTRSAGLSPPNISIPPAPNNTSITFYLPADLDLNDGNTTIVDANGNIEWDVANPLQYLYAADEKQLRRIENGQLMVLADNVQSVTFADESIDPTLKSNEIRVTLTLQRRTPKQRVLSATSTAIVRLRN